MQKDILLETERLILRRFMEADAENLYDLDNDPEVMRFINGGVPVSRKIIQNKILPGFLHYNAQYPGYGFWAITKKDSGEFLGWLSFRPTGLKPNEVTLGFRLRKTAWGNGYATEGSKALLCRGFTKMGVQRVVATTYEENLASRRVMEKIGMKLVRMFRITPEDLEKVDTFHVESTDLWDGHDLEYVLEKAESEKHFFKDQ